MASEEECRAIIAAVERERGRSLSDDLIERSGGDPAWLRRMLDQRSPASAGERALLDARARLLCGDIDGACGALDGPRDRAERNEPPGTHLLRAEALIREGDPVAARDELARGSGGAEREDPSLAILVAGLHVLRGELATGRRVLRAASADGDGLFEARRAGVVALSYFCEERYPRVAGWARRARLAHLRASDGPVEPLILMAELIALLESDRLDRAAALATRRSEGTRLRDRGEPLGKGLGILFEAGLLGRRGELAETVALLELAYRGLAARSDRLAQAVTARYLARALTGLGRFDQADEVLKSAAAAASSPGLDALGPYQERERAKVAEARGDRPEARARIAAALTRAPGNPYLRLDAWFFYEGDAPLPRPALSSPALSAYGALRAAERALERGVLVEAEAAARLATGWYRPAGIKHELARARLAEAEALARQGRCAPAFEALAECEALAEPRGYAPVLVAAALVRASLADRAGDLSAYRASLKAARAFAGAELLDLALGRALARVGLTDGRELRAGAPQPFRALVARLGLDRPVAALSFGPRLRLLSEEEIPDEPIDLWLDVDQGCVVGPGGRHPLTAQRRAMLALFAEAGSSGWTLEDLFHRLWGGGEYHPLNHRAVLYTAIARFRRSVQPLCGRDPLQRLGETRYRIAPELRVGIRHPAGVPELLSSGRAAFADRPRAG